MSVRVSISYLPSCHLWLLLVLALVYLRFSDQNPGDALCIDGERQALIAFKHGLVDEAGRLASWVDEKSDCCRWDGIVCDNITGHVHEIHLRGPHEIYYGTMKHLKEVSKQKFGGHLSPSLLELKQLKYLDLSCNDFKNIQIPSFIGSLRNLRYLNLSGSNFGGMIPPQIGNISELRVLSLRNLEGTSLMMKMQSLSSLRWLHHLDISGIDLSKALDWFQVINTLPSLVELHLFDCQLSDAHPYVPNLNATSLSLLDLSFNNFKHSLIPWWIFSLTNLVSLDLSYNGFHDPLANGTFNFRNLTSLSSLYAGGNNLMNSPAVLRGLSSTNLKLLGISSCGISSSVLCSLRNLTSLLSLDVSRNQLTEAIPDSFGNLCNLRGIDLSYNNFGNIGITYLLKSLFYCKSLSLESLIISDSGLSGPIPDSIGQLSSLKMLDLSENRLNGTIPNSIGQLSSLEVLHLSYNRLNNNLPVSLGQLSKLSDLDLSDNLLTGVVTEAHFANLVSLKSLNGARNNLTLKLLVANWIPPFQMRNLNLDCWRLGPKFPSWLQSQRDLISLCLRNTHISSLMPPKSFWRLFPNLAFLDMSQNHMKGKLIWCVPTTLEILDLSSNELTGMLPSLSNGSLMPIYLDLSDNYFMGSLHHLVCFNGVHETKFLSLGYNHLSGVIPECWKKWSRLKVLNLKNNILSGEIPQTFGSLLNLSWLNMHRNKISGRLPSSLMNLSRLITLQLGRNEIVGSIPPWIGAKLTSLRVLGLRFNNLFGSIPLELCYLSHTQIIDLAHNKLSGNIPRCFNNFSAFSVPANSIEDFIMDSEEGSFLMGSDTLVMKGQENTYDSILWQVTLLDLSSNKFSGHIPSELTTLRELKSLNLSRNRLIGRIPEKIGDMNALESFDLSFNNLSGELPISLSRLNFLSNFNVSYNNLMGRVPVGTQLQSFSESNFFGNQLCGAPLRDLCVPIEVPTQTIGDKKEDNGLEWGLIISFVLGFVTGFWIILAPLIISTSWRITHFRLMRKLIKGRS